MQTWTKKDKIACIFIFTIAILTFVTFLSTITLSYFYDKHTVNDIVTAGKVSITVKGGHDGNGTIKFPDVITPYTSYRTDSYPELAYTVKNTSTSGAIFLMLEVRNNFDGVIIPTRHGMNSHQYFYQGDPDATYAEGDSATNYLFYYEPLLYNNSVTVIQSWYVGNIGNDISGNDVSITITAHAVQVQGGAIEHMQGGWQYAPAEFIEMTEAYY